MYWLNLKSVAFPVPEIIGGSQKNLGSPWIRPRSFFSKIFHGRLFRWTLSNVLAKFEICSFHCSWDNRGYPKNLGSPWIRPRSLFYKMFNGLLFGWTVCMYWPNLKSVAFPVPEIIGGTRKNWAVPGYAHAPFSPKSLMGFCSDGPSEYTGQVWSS